MSIENLCISYSGNNKYSATTKGEYLKIEFEEHTLTTENVSFEQLLVGILQAEYYSYPNISIDFPEEIEEQRQIVKGIFEMREKVVKDFHEKISYSIRSRMKLKEELNYLKNKK